MRKFILIASFLAFSSGCSKLGFMSVESVDPSSAQTQISNSLAGQLAPVRLEVYPDEVFVPAGVCKGFTVNSRAQNGLLSGVATDLLFSLSSDNGGKFYLDADCSQEMSQAVIAKGFYSKRVYFKSAPMKGSTSDNLRIVASTRYFANSANVPSTFTSILSLVNTKPETENVTLALDEDTSNSIQIPASDENGDSLTFISTAPATRASAWSLSPSGLLTYSPIPNANGPDTIKYRVFDGRTYSDEKTATVTVTPVNDAPTATALSSVTVAEDTPQSIDLRSFFSDVDLDPNLNQGYSEVLNYEVTAYPSPLSGVLSTSGNIRTFNPVLNSNVNSSFDVEVTDKAGVKLKRTIALNITPVNDAPTLTRVDKLVGASEDVPFDFKLDGNKTDLFDVDSPNPGFRIETIVSGTLKKNGVLVSAGSTFLPTDQMTWQSAPNGFGSPVNAFSIRGYDGALASSSPITVQIDVASVNDVPVVATNASLTLLEGGNARITTSYLNVTDADSPPPSSLVFTVTRVPSYGTLRLGSATGTLVGLGSVFTQADLNASNLFYVHDGSETTADSFGFNVSDGQGGTVTGQNFNINVTPVNDAPVITALPDQEFVNSAAYSFNIIASDAENDTLTYSVTGISPVVGSYSIAGNRITYFPSNSFVGTVVMSYKVRDNGTPNKETSSSVNLIVGNGSPQIVTNTTLNAVGIPVGSYVVVNSSNLQSKISGIPSVPANQIIYAIQSVPSRGVLRLSTNPSLNLLVGDTFTQDDLNNSRVRYYNNSSGGATDSFTFTVYQSTDPADATAITTFNIIR